MEMHRCVVRRIYRSGLVDVKSLTSGTVFERIQVGFSSGIESDVSIDEEVLVLHDGNQTYAVATLHKQNLTKTNQTTVKNSKNDLSELGDAKAMVAQDEFGNQSRVVASAGAGVTCDTGRRCVTHWDSGQEMRRDFYERCRTLSVPSYKEENHDENTCSTRYRFRTVVDREAVNREYDYNIDPSQDDGGVVDVQIGPDTDLLNMRIWQDGEQKLSIEIDPSGDFTMSTEGNVNMDAEGDIDMSARGSSVNISSDGSVQMSTAAGAIRVTPTGQIYLGQDPGIELLTILDQLYVSLTSAFTVTTLGPQPLIPLTTVAPILKALNDLIKE